MITDQHRAFARAVVAAAREHGMAKVTMHLQFHAGFDHPASYKNIKLYWHEGRHGAEKNISLSYTEDTVVTERVAP
jgi:hypothetical protein